MTVGRLDGDTRAAGPHRGTVREQARSHSGANASHYPQLKA